MKKLLAILVLGLLWCNVGFADPDKLLDYQDRSMHDPKEMKELGYI